MKEPWQFLSNTSLAVMFFFPARLISGNYQLKQTFLVSSKIFALTNIQG